MRLQIVNTTGYARDTRIVDAATGAPVEDVLSVVIHITPHNFVTADLTMILRDCDVLAEAEVSS